MKNQLCLCRPHSIYILGLKPCQEAEMLLMQGGTEHEMPELPEGRHWDVVDLPNFGGEANTFAEHLVRRYDSLAAYTIFSQVLGSLHINLEIQ